MLNLLLIFVLVMRAHAQETTAACEDMELEQLPSKVGTYRLKDAEISKKK